MSIMHRLQAKPLGHAHLITTTCWLVVGAENQLWSLGFVGGVSSQLHLGSFWVFWGVQLGVRTLCEEERLSQLPCKCWL